MVKKMRVYFAAPLFTQAEWVWNAGLAEALAGHGFDVLLPQLAAKPMLYGQKPFDAAPMFAENRGEIDKADAVLAVLDQPDPDSGTCWECGYAYGTGKPVVGLRTDIRPGGDDPAKHVNLMLAQSCAEFLNVPPDRRDDLAWVAEQLAGLLNKVGGAKP